MDPHIKQDQIAQHVSKIIWLLTGKRPVGALADTPARVARAMVNEWFSGYGRSTDDPGVMRAFKIGAPSDSMVVQHGVPVWSTCEHHMAPFFGRAAIAYIPGPEGLVVGLSKFKRLVDVYARRFQVQERLTAQVAEALSAGLGALGVGVFLRCRHTCMESRGINVHGAVTDTCTLLGVFRDDPTVRDEFLSSVRGVSWDV